jgi:hypothetical protein
METVRTADDCVARLASHADGKFDKIITDLRSLNVLRTQVVCPGCGQHTLKLATPTKCTTLRVKCPNRCCKHAGRNGLDWTYGSFFHEYNIDTFALLHVLNKFAHKRAPGDAVAEIPTDAPTGKKIIGKRTCTDVYKHVQEILLAYNTTCVLAYHNKFGGIISSLADNAKKGRPVTEDWFVNQLNHTQVCVFVCACVCIFVCTCVFTCAAVCIHMHGHV